jgi:hypothetical protein
MGGSFLLMEKLKEEAFPPRQNISTITSGVVFPVAGI